MTAAFLLLGALYLAAIGPYWTISPDSATYVLAAQSLAAGDGYVIRGSPVSLRPPVPSMIFGAVLFFFPGSYFALNAAVTAFALASVWLTFVLFHERVSATAASVLALFSLGSVLLFHESRLLLSDVIYTGFALVALVVARRALVRPRGPTVYLVTALVLLVACMTRIVGLALVLAVVAAHAVEWLRGRVRLDLAVLGTMAGVALCVGVWEYRNLQVGLSFTQLFLLREPWVAEAGYVSPPELAARFLRNLSDYGYIADILTNQSLTATGIGARPAARALLWLPVAAVGCGLAVSLRRNASVADWYALVYLLVLGVYWPEIEPRWFVPLIPFLFYYAARGLRFVLARLEAATPVRLSAAMYALLALYGIGYLAAGVHSMVRAIPDIHTSQFGSHPIRYVFNYDTQRLALRLRDISRPDASYVCLHPKIMDLVTERKGYAFPLSKNPARLTALLRNKRIGYVLADKKKREDQQFLFPVIHAYPDHFRLIQDEPHAALYEFTPPDTR